MEVLHYEVVDMSISSLVLIAIIIGIVLLSVFIGVCVDSSLGVAIGIVGTAFMLFLFFANEDDKYEYQKVVVSDWNVVHSEGWEVIKQEGDIVELKRRLVEVE